MSNDKKEPSARRRVFDKFDELSTQYDNRIKGNWYTIANIAAHLKMGLCSNEGEIMLGHSSCDSMRAEMFDAMRYIVELTELRNEQLRGDDASKETSIITCEELTDFVMLRDNATVLSTSPLADIINKFCSR